MPFFTAISTQAELSTSPVLLATSDADFPQGRTLFSGDGIYLYDSGAGSLFTVSVDSTVLRTGSSASVNSLYASTTVQADAGFVLNSGSGTATIDYAGSTTYTLNLPNGLGTNGQVLKTDGSGSTSWYTIPATTPAGSNTQLQYNSSGSFGASSNLTWDGTDLRVAANVKANTLNFVSGVNTSAVMQYGGMPNGGSTHGKGVKLIGSAVSGQRPYVGLSTKGNSTDTELGWFANTADDTIAFGVGGFTGFSCNGLAESFTLGSQPGVQTFLGRVTFTGSVTYGLVRRQTLILRAASTSGGATGTPNIFEVTNNAVSITYWQISDAGNLESPTAGYGIGLKEGTNAKMGVATLAAGTVTVSTNKVTANSRIFLSTQSAGGTVGYPYVSARTAGTSFTITSTSATDTSMVAWLIVEPT